MNSRGEENKIIWPNQLESNHIKPESKTKQEPDVLGVLLCSCLFLPCLWIGWSIGRSQVGNHRNLPNSTPILAGWLWWNEKWIDHYDSSSPSFFVFLFFLSWLVSSFFSCWLLEFVWGLAISKSCLICWGVIPYIEWWCWACGDSARSGADAWLGLGWSQVFEGSMNGFRMFWVWFEAILKYVWVWGTCWDEVVCSRKVGVEIWMNGSM